MLSVGASENFLKGSDSMRRQYVALGANVRSLPLQASKRWRLVERESGRLSLGLLFGCLKDSDCLDLLRKQTFVLDPSDVDFRNLCLEPCYCGRLDTRDWWIL